MFEKFINKLTGNAKKIVEEGFLITDVEDFKKLNYFLGLFLSFLKAEFKLDIKSVADFHLHIGNKDINEIRMSFFKYINSIEDITYDYLCLAKNLIHDIVGDELASNRTLNFSIQMPNDSNSLLPIHSDTFSGESEFQINLWIPLVDSYDSNSMFIFNPKFSKETLIKIDDFEKSGLDHLLSNYPDEYQFLNVKYGQALIFTPTCLHGNILNKTSKTRVSFNCRYKNLFSPYNKHEENEKKLGAFYKPISVKAASIIGFNHKIGRKK